MSKVHTKVYQIQHKGSSWRMEVSPEKVILRSGSQSILVVPQAINAVEYTEIMLLWRLLTGILLIGVALLLYRASYDYSFWTPFVILGILGMLYYFWPKRVLVIRTCGYSLVIEGRETKEIFDHLCQLLSRGE